MGFQFGAILADDTRYKEAIARREAILARLQELQAELRAVDDFVNLYERLFPKSGDPMDSRRREDQEAQEHRGLRQRNVLAPARLAEICREIILESGQPMTRSELLRAIEKRGIPIAGSDPSKNLGTILWRARDRFDHIAKRGYWPSDVPLTD